MRILAVANQKGGCGKTTTAVSLAWCLAARGRKTLLVDLDPQAHSTLALGVNPERLDLHIGDILLDSVFDVDSLRLSQIIHSVRSNLSLAPGGVDLSAIEHTLANVNGREERLAEHLAGMDDIYDVAILDCPPALGLLTFNALIAAAEAIVPVDSSPLSVQGLGRLKETARLIHEMTGHTVKLRPVLTLHDPRTRNSREIYQLLLSEFGSEAFATPIRYTVRLREKIGKGRIRSALAPSSSSAHDYGALADQLIIEESAVGGRPRDHEAVPVLKHVAGGLTLSFAGSEPEEVLLAGDFNGWIPDAGVKLVRDGEGHWSKTVRIEPGTYQYRFVLRGAWVSDPRNPHQITNDYGSRNSLIQVE
jgi:chromosome partitioning protein